MIVLGLSPDKSAPEPGFSQTHLRQFGHNIIEVFATDAAAGQFLIIL